MMVVSITSTNGLFQRTGQSEEINSGSRLFKQHKAIAIVPLSSAQGATSIVAPAATQKLRA